MTSPAQGARALRIAYVGQMADVGSENGISKKIRGQAAHWLAAGHAVRYFSLAPSGTLWAGLAPLETELVPRGGFSQRVFRSMQLAARIRAWQPDVIYFRYAYHSPGFRRLFREIPTVAEINSDDLTEYRLSLSGPKQLYHRLTRQRILGAVTAFVTVTRELARRFSGLHRPTQVIANGIELAAFSPLAPAPRDQPIRLVFVGSAGTPWHGLERVAELATLFPDWRFEVIGCTAVDVPREANVALPPNLQFHGPLPRSRYEPMFQSATVALGTLGLFRKKMEEACPLKVREYLAVGLPVIGGYEDTDIPANAPYFLRLPNDSTPLAPRRAEINSFVETWRHRRLDRSTVSHLDMRVKEQQRLAFLAAVRTGRTR